MLCRLFLALWLFLLLPAASFAATFTWDGGGGDDNWSTAANWNPNTVPGSTGSVVFNSTSSDNVTVDTNILVHSIAIGQGYGGTITQSGAIMVGTGGFTQGGGTFTGGSAPILIHRNLTLTGGTLQSTSGVLSISGSLIRTGGTFTHNSGTVSLAAPANRTLTSTSTFHRLDIESTKETGLVGYWKLDETAGTRIVDSSGRGFTGALVNGPSATSSVAPLQFSNLRGRNFDGSDDYASVGSPSNMAGSASWSVWLKPDTWSYASKDFGVAGIVSKGYWGTVEGNFSIVNETAIFAGNTQFVDCAIYTDTDTYTIQYNAGVNLPTGAWYHLACVYDEDEQLLTFYINGTEVGSSATAGTVTFGSDKIVSIGAFPGNEGNTETDGVIDDVRLYSRALSADEVADLADGLYPTRTGGSTVTASTDITTSSAINIWNGTFALGSNTLTSEGSLINQGTLSVSGGSLLSSSSLSISPASGSIGTTLTITLTDADQNLDGTDEETVSFSIGGESITLTETTASSGVFQGTIATAHGTEVNGNSIIENDDFCSFTLSPVYRDEGDGTDTSTDSTLITDAAVPCEIYGSGGGGGRRTTGNTSIAPVHHSPLSPAQSAPPGPALPAGSPLANMRVRLVERIEQRIAEHPRLSNLLWAVLKRLDERIAARLRR